MSMVREASPLIEYLEQHSQKTWDDLVVKLGESMHPVDREATRIWFAFWPLELAKALRETDDLEGLVREWRLTGNYRLEEQLDKSVEFLWGAYFWLQVKEAVLEVAESRRDPAAAGLEGLIREAAGLAARKSGKDVALLLGATAVALMALRQIGIEDFTLVVQRPSTRRGKPADPEKLLRLRSKPAAPGLFGFLKTVDRKFRILFDESDQRRCTFHALHGQDISMASASDRRDYASTDPRRLEGPVPFECRSGSCGFCWIGVLGGRERLAEISEYERKRLRYFGYMGPDSPPESHPPIRLSCQAQCYGDLSIVIPPWNGTLGGKKVTQASR